MEKPKIEDVNTSSPRLDKLLNAFQVRGLTIFVPEGLNDNEAVNHIEGLEQDNLELKESLWGEDLTLSIKAEMHRTLKATLESAIGGENIRGEDVKSFLGAMMTVVIHSLPDHVHLVGKEERSKILLSEINFVNRFLNYELDVHNTTADIYSAIFSIKPLASYTTVNMTVEAFGAGDRKSIYKGMDSGRVYPYSEENYQWSEGGAGLTIVRRQFRRPGLVITAPMNIEDQKYIAIASTPYASGWERLLEENIVTIS